MSSKYTGRQIALFSDVHGLFEPLEAVLEDINKRNITEIYSLGDNIGVGPNPSEVIDLLKYYNIRSIAGNAEEYCIIGIEPYISSFDLRKAMSQEWTESVLGKNRIDYIKQFPKSIDLNVGGKKVSLCHFANDIRIDYGLYGTEKYFHNYNNGCSYKQFLYTNSEEQKQLINYNINKYGDDNPIMRGYVSARENPIFNGKTVDYYDTIIQGHMHRNLYEKGNDIDFYSIRALAVHFDDDPIDMAFYIILHERIDNMGFDIEKIYVPFNREVMKDTINKSSEPTGIIRKLVRM